MKRTLYFFLLFAFAILPQVLMAQQGTVAGEGNATGFSGSVSYTIGQVVYTAQSSSEGNINQGIQQPFDVLMVSTSEIGDAFTTTIYPNPASTAIHVQIDADAYGNYDLHDLSYTLTDMNGRHLKHDAILSSSTMVPVDGLSEAIYFLNIQYRHENIKTFKIIKTNDQ